MFCNNCGSQLPDNAAFCSSCGAQVNVSTQPVYTAPQQQYSVPVYNNTPTGNYSGTAVLGGKIVGIVALLAAIIANILMCVTEVLTYGLKSNSAYDETYNIFKFLDLGSGSDKADSAMGCIIAGIVCATIGVWLLVVVIASKRAKPGCAIGAGMCFIMYLICMIVSVYAILSDGKPSSVKFGFGAIGWIAIALVAVAAVAAFIAGVQAKKQKAAAPIRF
ncbi:MAG: zinc ribbon domain-containing protein [Ruminococcus sp.]|nr:zinc ribbon domain-containing protein [Ruminococcus sp.]